MIYPNHTTIKAKLLLITILFLSVSIQLFSQKQSLDIKVGDPTSKGVLTGMMGVVGTTSDGFYLLRSQSKGFSFYGMGVGTKGELSLEKYNKNLNHVQSIWIKDIPMTLLNKARGKSFEFFYQDGNEDLWLFYSDESKGYNQLFRKRLNEDSFEEPILVSKQKIVAKELDRRSSYKIIESENKTSFAVYSFVGNSRTEKSYVYVEVFDNQMNSQWEMNTVAPDFDRDGYVSKAFSFSESLETKNRNIFLSDQGSLNIVKKAFNRKEKKNYLHIIYSFNKDIEEPVVNFLRNSDDKYILEALLTQDKEGSLKLAGFYSDTKRSKKINGIFLQNLDPFSLEIQDEKFIQFSNEDKKAFLFEDEESMSKKNKNKIENGKELDVSANNLIRSLYVNENNSITVSSEYYRWYQKSSTNGNGGGSRFIFGNLQFLNISQDGKINWIKSFAKRQRGEVEMLLGVYEMFNDDVIHFIYNDVKNGELKAGQINSKGEVSSKSITSLKKKGALEKFWYIPNTTTKLEDDSYIGFAIKYFKQRLLKIEIE